MCHLGGKRCAQAPALVLSLHVYPNLLERIRVFCSRGQAHYCTGANGYRRDGHVPPLG